MSAIEKLREAATRRRDVAVPSERRRDYALNEAWRICKGMIFARAQLEGDPELARVFEKHAESLADSVLEVANE